MHSAPSSTDREFFSKFLKTKPMKYFRNILLLASSLLLAFSVSGSEVSSETAVAIVRNWLRFDRIPLGEPLGNQVKEVETFKDKSGNVLYHVVYLEPSGFVIVPGDDLVEPIIAFARCGHYDPSLDNPLGALVSGDVPRRVAHARALRTTAITSHFLESRNKWQLVQNIFIGGPSPAFSSNSVSTVSDLRIAPLVQTLWNQSTANNGMACYNYYTPPYAAGAPSNYVHTGPIRGKSRGFHFDSRRGFAFHGES